MATYGKKAGDKVEAAMDERKKGTLRSGRSGKTVTSRKQAIAIGLSEARKEGAKVPAKKAPAKKTPAKKAVAKKVAAKKAPAKKTAARKAPAKKAARKTAKSSS
jgi:topoisomerase IA-like protein